jgi:hypothetical protein
MSYTCEIHGKLRMSQICPECLDELRITHDELNAIWRAKLILDEYYSGTTRDWMPATIRQTSIDLDHICTRLKPIVQP